MRRIFLHPAWLPVVLVGFFVLGAGVGQRAGGGAATTTVVRHATATSTVVSFTPGSTVTVTSTKIVAPQTTPASTGSTSIAVTMRYGRWYGKFRATGLSMRTSGVGAEIVGQFENTRACSTADVTLDATFYRNGAVVGSGSGFVPSAPEGTPVSLDVIGYPTGTPDHATVVISNVLCS